MPPAGPATPPRERIEVLDSLRGFALLGVILVNVGGSLDDPSGALDTAVSWFVSVLFSNKSWPLLSLLFGLGFAIQIERSKTRGWGVVWMHLRRMAVLYGFGIALVVLFDGNVILVRYAAAGVFLLPFAWLPARWVLASCLVFFVVSTFDSFVYWEYVLRPRLALRPLAQAVPPQEPQTLVEFTVRELQRVPLSAFRANFWPGRQTQIFAMFLLGMYVGKRRIHAAIAEHRRLWLIGVKWLLPIGLAITLWHFYFLGEQPRDPLVILILRYAVGALGGHMLTLGYASAFALVSLNEYLPKLMRFLGNYGRMPLTLYLMQWLLMRLVFDRFFLGYEGTLGPAMGFAIALGIYSLQAELAPVWLRRFTMGPAEWLWKSITYLRWEPFRLATAPALSARQSESSYSA